MKVSQLSLKQFRNLEAISIAPHPNFNLIVGLNASGKTNLCEALYFASRGQVLKGERQREVIAWGKTWCTIKVFVDVNEVRVHLDQEQTAKTVTLNEETVNQREVFEAFKALIFTPDDLQVIKGGPARRRHLLDRAIADVDPVYGREARAYEHVVRRKNALLKQGRGDLELLGVYNRKLVAHGARLVEKRLEYLAAIEDDLGTYHSALTQAHSPLTTRYDSEVGYGADIEPTLNVAVEAALADEQLRRQSLVGPHRDDVGFEVEGVDLRRYGSQGQQKTALIALKLAQLQHFHNTQGAFPVLILDDVLSELDPQRTQLLLDHLPRDIQLFLTETRLSDALRARAGKVFQVNQGKVVEMTKEAQCASKI